jgi:lysophospholipase L1-like esterase
MARLFNRRILIALSSWLVLNLGLVWFASTMRSVVVDSWKKGPLIDPAAPYAPENAQLYLMWIALWVFNTYLLGLIVSVRFGNGWVRTFAPGVILILSLISAEIGMQRYLENNQTTHFRPHPTLHWMCRPNLQSFESSSDGIILNTNQHGMREAPIEYEKAEGEFRIIVLGDSSNFGQGVSGTEMWSNQLAEILSSASTQKVTVLNAACPGWTTHQGVEVMESYGWKFEPDMVIGGFNNDAGPDFMTDRERVSPSKTIRQIQRVLYQSEVFVISREALLSWIRKLSPTAQTAYKTRLAGEKAKYGKLGKEEQLPLVARVPLSEMEENLLFLKEKSNENNAQFVWVNMPINRKEFDLVDRYVNWNYRSRMIEFTTANDILYIGVDEYWQRTRETDLHILGHVFHPNKTGHRRMAEQIAQALSQEEFVPIQSKQVPIGGPPPASSVDVLRLGWSSKTPIHSHIGVALQRHPELFEKHGLEIELVSFQSGKSQGKALADGELDAWFSCAVPAIHMLDSRKDAKVVASFGPLGDIALMTPKSTDLSELQKVALSSGSSPHMRWKQWSNKYQINTQVIDVRTPDLTNLLLREEVDGLVMWDPWITEWKQKYGWESLLNEPFYSVLIVGEMWALGDLKDPRVPRLIALFKDAIQYVEAEADSIDAEVAKLGDWSFDTVRYIREQNPIFKTRDLRIPVEVQKELTESRKFVTPGARAFYALAEEWQQGFPKQERR